MKSKGIQPQDGFQLLIQNPKEIISDLDGTESSREEGEEEGREVEGSVLCRHDLIVCVCVCE